MKKKLLLITLSFVTFLSVNITKAQTNFNFETWSGSPLSPDNWSTLNILTTGNYIKDTSVVRVVGESGFAAQLQPVSLKAAGPQYGNTRLSLILYKDTISISPDSVSFYYKYKPDTNAASVTLIALTAWDVNNNVRDTVAQVKFTPSKTDTIKVFTLQKLALTYKPKNTTRPDSLTIEFTLVAADSTGKQARLVVDEIKLLGAHTYPSGAGISVINNKTNIAVYPSIASTSVNFDFANNSNLVNITIYDLTGRKVKTVTNNTDKYSLNVTEFTEGCYIYKISDLSNNELKTGKFVVNHQ